MTGIKRLAGMVWAGALLAAAAPAHADWALNMPKGVTQTSREIYDLHMTIFWIVVAIGVVVFGAMVISLIFHRKSRGVKPAQFHHSTAVEIVWTIIPIVILVAMAVPASRVLIDSYDTGETDMTVVVTGYQWMWEYEYPAEGISFYSKLDEKSDIARRRGSGIDPASVDNYLVAVDNRLILPTNTRIKLQITAADVLHSWYVPALGGKRDAIPGYVNEIWTEIDEPGVYRGQCAELCGRDHAYMPVVVEAVPPAEYQAWVKEQTGGEDDQQQDAEQTADSGGEADMVATR